MHLITFTSDIHARLLRSSTSFELYTPKPNFEIYLNTFIFPIHQFSFRIPFLHIFKTQRLLSISNPNIYVGQTNLISIIAVVQLYFMKLCTLFGSVGVLRYSNRHINVKSIFINACIIVTLSCSYITHVCSCFVSFCLCLRPSWKIDLHTCIMSNECPL